MNPIVFLKNFAFIFLCTGLLCACDNTPETDDIVIGVAWIRSDDFIEGAKLATKEINQSGGVLNKQLRLLIDSGEEAIFAASKRASKRKVPFAARSSRELGTISPNIARSFSANPRLVAVVGHRLSMMAISAANVYHRKKVLFIAPTSTNDVLTSLGFEHVFRMQPRNTALGQQLAQYCHEQGYRKVAVIYDRTTYGEEMARSFSQSAQENYQIETTYRRAFFPYTPDRTFVKIAVDLSRAKDFDVVFLGTSSKSALKLYREMRRRGVTLPIVGVDSLDSNSFWEAIKQQELLQPTALRAMVITVYNQFSQPAQDFAERYMREYNKQPGRYAALGYDAIKLVTRGLQLAQSTESISVADELRYMEPCYGVAGFYQYQDSGDVVPEKLLYLKRIDGDKAFVFHQLSTAKSRTKLEKVECVDLDQDDDNIFDYEDQCPQNKPEELTQGVYHNGPRMGCPLTASLNQPSRHKKK